MTVTLRSGGRALAHELGPVLDRWTDRAPLLGQLHSGDVGWHLRNPDDLLGEAFWVWELDGRPAAVGLVEDSALRLSVDPDQVGSTALADAICSRLHDIEWTDALAGSVLRARLVEHGWQADPHPWVRLYRSLDRADAAYDDPGTRPVAGAADVAARVAVQRSAFAPGSTFTEELWARMAAGPAYDGRFDLVTWTSDGQPAAAATGWLSAGGAAILEPVGTHRDHQGQGYGKRVNLAVFAALSGAGATSVQVHTPMSNVGANRTYESCGMRPIDYTAAMWSGAAS